MSILTLADDKFVPLYRVMWVSSTPHFCGDEECEAEGKYEIRLEQGEVIWGTRDDRDKMVDALERWQGGLGSEEESWE